VVTPTSCGNPAVRPSWSPRTVKEAGLNGLDIGIAGGTLARVTPHTYPVVLGRDAAGPATLC